MISNDWYQIKIPRNLIDCGGNKSLSSIVSNGYIVALSPINDNPRSVRSRGGVSCR